MDILQVRGKFVQHSDTLFKVAFPEVPLVWGNAPFDRNSPPDVYVEASVEFEHAEKPALNSDLARHYGTLYFRAVTKKGLGTQVASNALSWILLKYKHAIVDGHQCGTPYLAGEGTASDGYEMNLNVPVTTRPL